MESQESQEMVLNRVAVANLTLEQTQKALLEHLKAINPQLSEVLEGQTGGASFKWHVNKWDDDDKFCTVEIGLLAPISSEEENHE